MKTIDEEDMKILEAVRNKPCFFYNTYAEILGWPHRKVIGRLTGLKHRGFLQGRKVYEDTQRWCYKTRYYINRRYAWRVFSEAKIFRELGILNF